MRRKKLVYRVESVPNPEVKQIHFRRVLTRRGILSLQHGFPEDKHPLGNKLLEVQGVMSVFIQKYEIQLEKALLFSWDKLLPRVLATIREHYGIEEMFEMT